MNLAQVADELYGLTPAEFIPARDESARRARAAGDADLARAIMKFRRPTVSAWLVNRLAREGGDRLDQLLELGESLREAQRTLAGDRLRELSGQRRELVGAIVQDAKRLAANSGQALSAQAEREVAATLEAALADPDAARAVRSGQLTRPLSHVGLGDEDMGTVIAFPGALREPARRGADRRQTRGPAPGESAASVRAGEVTTGKGRASRTAGTPRAVTRTPRVAGQTGRTAAQQREERAAAAARRAAEAAEQRRAREAEAAARDLREAREIAREARSALDEAEDRLGGVRAQRQAARQRAEELERQLGEAEAEQTSLTRAVREAQRSRDLAAKWLDTAERRLARAQDRAAKPT